MSAMLHGHETGAAWNEHGQHEPVVFGADRHLAAILLCNVPDRLHAETVPVPVVSLRGAQVAVRILLESGIVIILDTYHCELILRI